MDDNRVSRTPEIEEQILKRISVGESLRSICEDRGMPDRVTVWRWMEADGEFATKCARARELQAEALHDELARIEDECEAGTIDARAASVVLSSKQWRMSKLRPKRYGNQTSVELTGSVTVRATTVSDDELAAIAKGAG